MKKAVVIIALFLALAFALCACSLIGGNDTPSAPSQAAASREVSTPAYSQPEPVSVPEQSAALAKVRAVFFDRGVQVGDTGELDAGTELEPVDFIINDDNDGTPEGFPYVLNEDTSFTALLKITPINYHYDIYVKGELVRSADCSYGGMIDYPEVQSSIEGEDVFIFLGWKYNGVFDGMIRQNAVENLTIEAYFAETQILKYYYAGSMFAKYQPAGEKLTGLDEWNVYAGDGYKIAWYTDSSFTQRSTFDAMIEGNLTLYGRQEPADGAAYRRIENKTQLLDYFFSLLLARKTEAELFIEYDYGSLNDMMKYLTDKAPELYGYKLSATASDKVNVKLTVKYSPFATTRTKKMIYTQLPSGNAVPEKTKRGPDFSDFAVKKASNSYTVNNSEALYYILENGMRPIIDDSARDLKKLYAKMEDVLREYVSDDMTDTEKALAIYRYIILNTTYDGELLEKVKSGADTEGNRSFCLEGVFEDGLAVCDGMSKAFCCLCRMEGMECVRVVGKKTESGVAHAWNKVKIDGRWYVVDVTSGGTLVGNDEVLSYRYFMITDKQNEKTSVPDKGSRTDLKCDTEFDVHAYLGAEASSAEEAAEMLKSYFGHAPNGRSTYEIKLTYGVRSDDEAVKQILDALNMTISISYTGTDGVYCFIYDK